MFLLTQVKSLSKGKCQSLRGGATKHCHYSVQNISQENVFIVNEYTWYPEEYGAPTFGTERITFALQDLRPEKGGVKITVENCNTRLGSIAGLYYGYCAFFETSEKVFQFTDTNRTNKTSRMHVSFSTEEGARLFAISFWRILKTHYPETASNTLCPVLRGTFSSCESDDGTEVKYKVIELEFGLRYEKPYTSVKVDGVQIPGLMPLSSPELVRWRTRTAELLITCEDAKFVENYTFKENGMSLVHKELTYLKNGNLIKESKDPKGLESRVVTCKRR